MIQPLFTRLTPSQKRAVIFLLVLAALALVTLLIRAQRNAASASSPAASANPAPSRRRPALDPGQLERDIYTTTSGEVADLRENMTSLRDEITQALQDIHTRLDTAGASARAQDAPVGPVRVPPVSAPGIRVPPPPSQAIRSTAPPPTRSASPPPPPPEPVTPTVIGGIAHFRNPAPPQTQPGEEPDKKKPQPTTKVLLPVSFMAAKLLTGMDASTTRGAKSEPEPMLLRVQAPAVLPNEVVANLSGCFLAAEGTGQLDKERIAVRLLSLNCLYKNGKAAIVEDVAGYVTDSDGKIGLAGHAVSKMGPITWRAAVLGMIQGGGSALQAVASTQATSPLGTTTTLDTDRIGLAAAGGAVREGVKPLIDVYTELIKQSAPVLEKNPGADVVAVISQPVELHIRDLNDVKVAGVQ